MKIRHIPTHPDLAMPLALGRKVLTRRPLKPQPINVDDERILFGHGGEGFESCLWREDYPCPFGNPGDMIIFYFEGNPNGFFEAKQIGHRIERLLDITEEDVKKEGMETLEEFLIFWDQLYGDTEFSSHFNPYVWRIQFCKN